MRFPDEIVFDDCVKESEEEMVVMMLRRVSLEIDVNRINMAGMTALHQVVIRSTNYIFIKQSTPGGPGRQSAAGPGPRQSRGQHQQVGC